MALYSNNAASSMSMSRLRSGTSSFNVSSQAQCAKTVQQSPFCGLSTELVQVIASYLDLNSIKALRSTCRFASCA